MNVPCNFLSFISTNQRTNVDHNRISVRYVHCYMFRQLCVNPVGIDTTDQHTNNLDQGLYMQSPLHTACTRDYNIERILLYHQTTTK